jgi:hypothetical protein
MIAPLPNCFSIWASVRPTSAESGPSLLDPLAERLLPFWAIVWILLGLSIRAGWATGASPWHT